MTNSNFCTAFTELETAESKDGNFVIFNVNHDVCDKFLLCLTIEDITTHKASIESSPLIMNQTGKILIDQLLVTGNSRNRFISCEYINGILDLTTAQAVRGDKYFKNIATKWLNTHYAYVENSILTEDQRKYVRECVPF